MTKRKLTQSQAAEGCEEQEKYRSAIPEVVVLFDEELQQFHDWLLAKGDDPHVALALRWITEFEAFAEDDEQALNEIREMLRARNDSEAVMALQCITLMEETEAPHPMLHRLNLWLQAKGDNLTAVLSRWWLAEFEEAQAVEYQEDQSSKTYH